MLLGMFAILTGLAIGTLLCLLLDGMGVNENNPGCAVVATIFFGGALIGIIFGLDVLWFIIQFLLVLAIFLGVPFAIIITVEKEKMEDKN